MYLPTNQYQNQNRRNNPSVITQLCPNALGIYIDHHVNSLPSFLNHQLYITIFCNVMLFIRCWSHSTSQLLGYSTSLISFLLLIQAVTVLFILNNHSNLNNNNNSRIFTTLSPNQFMIGMTLGLCIGGTIISFILSKSYRNASRQCNALHRYTTLMMTSQGHSNNDNPTLDINNNVNHNNATISNAVADEEWQMILRHDPIIQYLCANSIQKILRTRTFWSSWLFWCNLINSILIAYGRPELTAFDNNAPPTAQSMYMGVPTNEPTNQHQMPAGAPYQPSSSSNTSTTNSSTNSASGYIGNYATIPEVRPISGIPPPISSSSALKSENNPATVMSV